MGKVTRPPVTQPNDTWALDFLHDTLADGSEVRQPGKLVQNAHIESFNGKFRAECLSERRFPLIPHELAQTFSVAPTTTTGGT